MRAASEFGDLTLSGSACGRKKVSIRNCRFRPRLAELRLQATEYEFPSVRALARCDLRCPRISFFFVLVLRYM